MNKLDPTLIKSPPGPVGMSPPDRMFHWPLITAFFGLIGLIVIDARPVWILLLLPAFFVANIIAVIGLLVNAWRRRWRKAASLALLPIFICCAIFLGKGLASPDIDLKFWGMRRSSDVDLNKRYAIRWDISSKNNEIEQDFFIGRIWPFGTPECYVSMSLHYTPLYNKETLFGFGGAPSARSNVIPIHIVLRGIEGEDSGKILIDKIMNPAGIGTAIEDGYPSKSIWHFYPKSGKYKVVVSNLDDTAVPDGIYPYLVINPYFDLK